VVVAGTCGERGGTGSGGSGGGGGGSVPDSDLDSDCEHVRDVDSGTPRQPGASTAAGTTHDRQATAARMVNAVSAAGAPSVAAVDSREAQSVDAARKACRLRRARMLRGHFRLATAALTKTKAPPTT